MCLKLVTSERRIRRVIALSPATLHYNSAKKDSNRDLDLWLCIIRLTRQYGRYVYRKIT